MFTKSARARGYSTLRAPTGSIRLARRAGIIVAISATVATINAAALVFGRFMQDESVNHYETLQISPNAEPDTIHRVYRLLALRFHPDNQETGSAERFRVVCEAYAVLSTTSRSTPFATIAGASSATAPDRTTTSSSSGPSV